MAGRTDRILNYLWNLLFWGSVVMLGLKGAWAQAVFIKAHATDGQYFTSNGVILQGGLIVTCTHCIQDHDGVRALREVLVDGNKAKVLTHDDNVALLGPMWVRKGATLAPKYPRKGSRIYQRYWKGGKYFERDCVWDGPNGLVRACVPLWYKFPKEKRAYPRNFIPGMSGSGLYDSNGYLVAIVQDVDGGTWTAEDIQKVLNEFKETNEIEGKAKR